MFVFKGIIIRLLQQLLLGLFLMTLQLCLCEDVVVREDHHEWCRLGQPREDQVSRSKVVISKLNNSDLLQVKFYFILSDDGDDESKRDCQFSMQHDNEEELILSTAVDAPPGNDDQCDQIGLFF